MRTVEIVLIEDNPGDVYLVKLALKENHIDHNLTHFESGSTAEQTLCDQSGKLDPPDLILMDLNTPRTDGFATLSRMKHSTRLLDVPIAIISSSRAQADKQQAALCGALYIEKPSQLADFISTIGESVRQMLSVQQV